MRMREQKYMYYLLTWDIVDLCSPIKSKQQCEVVWAEPKLPKALVNEN